MSAYRIGIDVGGTFTDLVLADGEGRVIGLYKAPTTPNQLVDGIIDALERTAADLGLPVDELLSRCMAFVYGTTIATNTLLTGSGSKVGLITTFGFRDSLEIRRGRRDNIWDIRTPFPPPLVPRFLRRGVHERINRRGQVETALDEAEVEQVLDELISFGVDSIAVCLFNSFLNGTHERQVRSILRERAPHLHCSLSCDVLPILGEYERTSTTSVDAYVGPRVATHLAELEQRLRDLSLQVPALVMINNGGVTRARFCRERPVLTVLSGPAAGHSAAQLYGAALDARRLILLDMGGTSSDVTLVVDGKAQQADLTSIAGYEIALRTVDVHTIGTGGGSIAFVDPGGLLRVGPEGAGADPGPACYGRGGERPTVTDAQLVLGRLNPAYFLGGELTLDSVAATRAIEQHVSSSTGLMPSEAAYAILQVATQNMADAIRLAALERGIDTREYMLLAAGGAAGLHAADVARDLGICRVLVPRLAAGLCALGMLHTDIIHDYVESIFQRWQPGLLPDLGVRLARMRETSRRDLQEEGFSEGSIIFEPLVDLRYAGQQWSIEVPLPDLDDPNCTADAEKAFHNLHEQLYGHHNPGSPLECIHLRLRAIGYSAKLRLPTENRGELPLPHAYRSVYLDRRKGFDPIPVYRGQSLPAEVSLRGPVLVEEPTTTVFVPPDWQLSIAETGDYVLSME